jgi:hypothetical protein
VICVVPGRTGCVIILDPIEVDKLESEELTDKPVVTVAG